MTRHDLVLKDTPVVVCRRCGAEFAWIETQGRLVSYDEMGWYVRHLGSSIWLPMPADGGQCR